MFPDQFETARLLLRPIEPGDAVAIFEGYAQDPAVTRYLAWHPHLSIADTQAYIASCLGEAFLRTYVLLEPKSGQLLGCLEMWLEAPYHLCFGYVLARPWWGKGLMTEALSAVMAWALRQDEIWLVAAECDVENLGSARVMEKAGLRREGTFRGWMVHPNLSLEPRDCFSYVLVR